MSNDDEVRIDRALLDRVAARDASAIAALHDRHGRLLFGLILRILCNRSEAEEVLQEVFLRAWTRIETYDAPGVRFPPHHHTGDEECYVISGSLIACGRRLVAGDFHHAEGGSDHGELFTEEGCRVLLVVPPEDYLPPVAG
jgi:hypothetical protein